MSEAKQEQGKNYIIQGSHNQAIQGERNIVGQQIQNSSGQEKELTQVQVAELLAQIERMIKESALPDPVKEKATKRLDAAADEVQEKEPDKQLAAGNLKRMTETLVEVSKTTAEGKKVWQNVQPILVQLAGWFRVAVDYFLDNV